MVNVRKIKAEDAAGFIALNQELAKETKLMMRELEECITDVAVVEKMIESFHKKGDFFYVAEVNEKMIGFTMAMKESLNRTKHRAYVVIGIRQAYQGQGIGGRLFDQLDKWAHEQSLRRLELTVMVHNEVGIALYEKKGFMVEGVKKDSMCVDGEYVDEYYMGRILE